jgi:hypothetical protein
MAGFLFVIYGATHQPLDFSAASDLQRNRTNRFAAGLRNFV